MTYMRYSPEFCTIVVEAMRGGMSRKALAGELGASYRSIGNWEKEHPEFAKALEEGKDASLHYWEQQGIKGMNGQIKGFQAAVWIFNMKNRFGWRDKQDVTSDDGPLQINIVRYEPKDAD